MTRKMFYQYGTQLADCSSFNSACEQAELNYEVEKFPLYCRGERVPKIQGIVRTDTNEVIGMGGELSYHLVNNSDAFSFGDALIERGILTPEFGGFIKRGAKNFIACRYNNPDSDNGGWKIAGDTIRPEMVFINDHSGKGGIRVSIIPFRMACYNQLSTVLTNSFVSIRHSSVVKTKLEMAWATVEALNEKMEEFIVKSNRLLLKKISKEDRTKLIKELIKYDELAEGRKLTEQTNALSGLENCFEVPDLANVKDTLWGFLNAVSDYDTHHRRIRKTENAIQYGLDNAFTLTNKAYHLISSL